MAELREAVTNPVPLLEIQKAADHAAAQSDRWLFVVLLIVGGIVAFLAARWLAGQYNRLLDQWRTDMRGMQEQIHGLHAERVKAADSFAAELRAIQKESAEASKDIFRAYGEALARNAETMGAVNHALRELQSSCAIARGGLIAYAPRRGGESAGRDVPSSSA